MGGFPWIPQIRQGSGQGGGEGGRRGEGVKGEEGGRRGGVCVVMMVGNEWGEGWCYPCSFFCFVF